MNIEIEKRRLVTALLEHISKKYGHYSCGLNLLGHELEKEYKVSLPTPSSSKLVLEALTLPTTLVLGIIIGLLA